MEIRTGRGGGAFQRGDDGIGVGGGPNLHEVPDDGVFMVNETILTSGRASSDRLTGTPPAYGASPGAVAPDRTRPGGIAGAAPQHMDMQLRHHIAQGADIELGDAGQASHDLAARATISSINTARSAAGRSMISTTSVPARHQHQPGIARIVHQQHTAERPVGDEGRVGCQARDARAKLMPRTCADRRRE